jgi:hypothetical protein
VEVGDRILDAHPGLNLSSSAARFRAIYSAKRVRTGTILVLHPDIIRDTFDTRFHGTSLSVEIVGIRRSYAPYDSRSEPENFLAAIKKLASITWSTSHSISPRIPSFMNDDAGLPTPIPVIAD